MMDLRNQFLEEFFKDDTYQYSSEENYGWVSLKREATTNKYSVTDDFYEEIRTISRFSYQFNDVYRGLIRTFLKYCFGKSYILTHEDDKYNIVWESFKKEIKWSKFSKELGLRFFRDGEVFIYLPEWKFINPSLIRTPIIEKDGKKEVNDNIHVGIEYDEEDYTKPIYYYIDQDGAFIKVEAKDIIYITNKDQDEWRGFTYFISVLTTCRNYKKWLQDRMILNRVRSSIGLEKILKKTSPEKVRNFAEATKTSELADKETSYGATYPRKVIEPGQIFVHNDAVEYKFLAPNVQASDVSEDGRRILLSIASAVGLPEYMISGDSSNANYASHLVSESNAIKEFDSWMEFFAEVFIDIWYKVMVQKGVVRDTTDIVKDPNVVIPTVVVRDLLKETQRNEILFQNNIIDSDEWRKRENITKEGEVLNYTDVQ